MDLLSLVIFMCILSSVSGEERMTLLEFKKSFFDPHGILDSWNGTVEMSHCSWFGVHCDMNSRVTRVEIIGNYNFSLSPSFSKVKSEHGCFDMLRNCSGRSEMKGKLSGKLSPVVADLKELKVLSLPFNELDGEIPFRIWGMENLEVLDLEGNGFFGDFSGFNFSGLRKLEVINLAFNKMSGAFSSSLWECRGLQVLNVAGNIISGIIPEFVGGLKKLRVINLSFNRLVGYLPISLGNECMDLEHLDLSANFLKGKIPRTLGNCCNLRTLLLSSNGLHGVVPKELGKLRNLEVLDVSKNRLHGPIPANIGNCTNLSNPVLSSNFSTRGETSCSLSLNDNNSFEGSLPDEITTLPNLKLLQATGTNIKDNFLGKLPFHMVKRLSNHVIPEPRHLVEKLHHEFFLLPLAHIISISAFLGIVLTVLIMFCYIRKKWVNSNPMTEIVPTASAQTNRVALFKSIGVKLTYEKIVLATENFSRRHCVGAGGFGRTYRAEVSPGKVIAVKRLASDRNQGVPQFEAEVRVLGRVSHPNIITLIGHYSGPTTDMLLMYDYLPGGNLDRFIRNRARRPFDWGTLHKIALHVASAVFYLHHHCDPRVLHRDIKPSNILLDADNNAYLSDFGLSKILATDETQATTRVAGTYGYIAPEYGLTGLLSNKADVYSYGVVLLELISDKRALDQSFYLQEDGFSIVSWARMLMDLGRAREVFAAGFWEAGPRDEMVKMLHVAILCTVESIAVRPSMRQVVQRLKQIRTPSGFGGQRRKGMF